MGTGGSVRGGSAYFRAVGHSFSAMSTNDLRDGLISGRTQLVIPLAASLVRTGELFSAELYWINRENPPATRGELLSALAWHGRFDLYSMMISRLDNPPDMEEGLHGDHCAAVCSAGWMQLRSDGLFHPEELVSKGDLLLLSFYFTGLEDSSWLPLDELDGFFR